MTSKAKLRGIIRATRSQGWTLVDEELELGLRSISAPIRARNGGIIAALNVCVPSVRITPPEIRARFLPELLAAAEKISKLVHS